jgi:hypothetical protein
MTRGCWRRWRAGTLARKGIIRQGQIKLDELLIAGKNYVLRIAGWLLASSLSCTK